MYRPVPFVRSRLFYPLFLWFLWSASSMRGLRIGIAGFLDFAAVDTELLPQLSDHAVLWLPREKDVQIDPVAGVDQKAEPTGGNARFITI